MVVEESYLRTAYDAVGDLYGSVDGYLADGLGLAPAVVERLRARLLA